MKPVYLSLAGLQSYRDKQEVDFAKLSDAGVFGIFGPTGSGKSSILDAMTLALYGKVERAPGGTQGIINQMETACTVAFAFELNGAGRTEQYRVERTYKRAGDASVNQSVARLVKLTEAGPVVLADKAKEVDARIQQILGLSMQDFTRAVVLPQGKFAEFLSLKGVERRHMLERLFHLEQYGDALSARVGAGVREADLAVKQAEAEQLGLGDASREALEAAGLRLAEAEAAALDARSRLAAAEKEAADKRELWKLLLERKALEEGSVRLSLRQAEMEAAGERLRLSEQARRVSHFIQEWREAGREQETAEQLLAAAEKEFAELTERHVSARVAYAAAQSRLAEEEGPLGERIARVRQALELAGELAGAQRTLEDASGQSAAMAREGLELAEQQAREEERHAKALALQQELKAQLAALSVPAGQTERLQQALGALHKLRAAREQASAAEAELEAARTHREAVLGPGSRAREELDRSRSQLAEMAGRGTVLAERLERAADAAAVLQHQAAAGEEAEQKREQEELKRTLAERLARDLEEGEPCPVCGSLTHPVRVLPCGSADAGHGAASAQSGDAKATAARWRQLLMEAKDLGHRAHSRSLALLAERDQHAGGGADSASEEVAATAVQAHEAEVPFAAVGEAERQLHSDRAALGELEAEAEAWSQALRRTASRLRQEETAVAEHSARLAAADTSAEAAAAKLGTARQLREEAEKSWPAAFPELAPEAVEPQWEKLQEGLRCQEELMGRLAKADPVLEDMAARLKRLTEEAAAKERDRIAGEARVQGLRAAQEEKRGKLRTLLDAELTEEETARLLDRLAERLRELKEREAAARSELDRRQAAVSEAAGRLAAARQARVSAGAALDRAKAHGQRELSASGFATVEEAMASLLPGDEAKVLEERLAAYREAVLKVQTAIGTIAGQIGERSLTEEEWQHCEADLAEARRADETALEQKARALRDKEELSLRHTRWLAIEEEREGALGRLRNLQKLQTVLRGNAFVEFMAMEQLLQVSRAASERLSQLTRRRYALETDSSGGFVIRDDANGGLRRPVSTLSGGETFLTSLSLALALSAQIQLNGTHPLEFFFLDEGFGTLDPELLETVVHALEKLHMERLTVGIISHVPELKSRLPRRLVVHPAESGGAGSRIAYETL